MYKIYNYYTGEKITEVSFFTYREAMYYWKEYTRDDVMGNLIIIKK